MVNSLVYLFPKSNEKLNGEATINILQNAKWDLDLDYNILLPSKDANGHLVYESGSHTLNPKQSPFVVYKNILLSKKDIKIKNNLLSISYAINDINPNISFTWSRKWFHFLDEREKFQYLQVILKCANISNASYVLFIEDLFDLFEDRLEDRFIMENYGRFFDDSPKKASGWDFAIDDIWIKNGTTIKLKSGRELIKSKVLAFDFVSYAIKNT